MTHANHGDTVAGKDTHTRQWTDTPSLALATFDQIETLGGPQLDIHFKLKTSFLPNLYRN